MSGLCRAPAWTHRLEAMFAKQVGDPRAVGDRADDVGPWRGRDIEADDRVTLRRQLGLEVASKPPRRAGQQYAHGFRAPRF